MSGYSHSDRAKVPGIKDPAAIQKRMCDGTNVYGMLPEVFSFKDLVAQSGAIPKSNSTVGLPPSLVEFKDRFKFLLPGGCQREDSPLV